VRLKRVEAGEHVCAFGSGEAVDEVGQLRVVSIEWDLRERVLLSWLGGVELQFRNRE
jgi:hypothetical protein